MKETNRRTDRQAILILWPTWTAAQNHGMIQLVLLERHHM